MPQSDDIKKPLKDWLADFHDDTAKLSELGRNLALAGIGLIWIFKNSDLTRDILPKELISPLRLIVISLALDLVQYLWCAINIYIFYRINANKYDRKLLSKADIEDVKMPNYLEVGTWVFFISKIIFTILAYSKIYQFLASRL